MIVVADTSPLNYLILIDQITILSRLFGSVAIPRAVYDELLRSSAPDEVRAWANRLPDWIKIHDLTGAPDPSLRNLDAGERDAILLFEVLHAQQLIIDDRRGQREADKRGIQTVGTLGVLRSAADARLLDFPGRARPAAKNQFLYIARGLEALTDVSARDNGALRSGLHEGTRVEEEFIADDQAIFESYQGGDATGADWFAAIEVVD